MGKAKRRLDSRFDPKGCKCGNKIRLSATLPLPADDFVSSHWIASETGAKISQRSDGWLEA